MVIGHWSVLIDARVTPQVTSRKKGTEELASYLRKIAAVGQTLFYASRYISLRTLHHYALTSETQGLFPLIFHKCKTCFGIDIRFLLPAAAIGRVPRKETNMNDNTPILPDFKDCNEKKKHLSSISQIHVILFWNKTDDKLGYINLFSDSSSEHKQRHPHAAMIRK